MAAIMYVQPGFAWGCLARMHETTAASMHVRQTHVCVMLVQSQAVICTMHVSIPFSPLQGHFGRSDPTCSNKFCILTRSSMIIAQSLLAWEFPIQAWMV